MYNLGEQLKQHRMSRKMTQEQLARELSNKMCFPITSVTLSQYENNKRTPNVDFLICFAEYMNCTVDSLLGIKRDGDDLERITNDLKYLLINRLVRSVEKMDIEELLEFIDSIEEIGL